MREDRKPWSGLRSPAARQLKRNTRYRTPWALPPNSSLDRRQRGLDDGRDLVVVDHERHVEWLAAGLRPSLWGGHRDEAVTDAACSGPNEMTIDARIASHESSS